MSRIYVPAGVAMLRALADTGELAPAGPVHTVTRELREAHPEADLEDLEYTAFADAALTALSLVHGPAASPEGPEREPRRVVVSADVPGDRVRERPGGTAADLEGVVELGKVAAVHVDDAEAAAEIAGLVEAPELDLAAVEAHFLDWYAPSELQDLLAGLGSRNP
ncbi:MAG TPA: hypothetical protein VKZ65_01460 [Glycomyces sp.]|nr:hypothetical protein [Glycomyces sp.]